LTVVAPPTAELREPTRDAPDALMKEARERQRRRHQRLALLLLLLAGIGGIGYGIDRGVGGGQSSPACAANACTDAGAIASGAAPSIVSVVAEPSGRRLSPGSLKIVPGKREQGLNVVPAPVNLAFKVTLHNGSTSWERNVKVTLTVYRSARRGHGPMIGRPSFRATTVQTQHARAIGPNRTEVITFSNRLLVPFATATRIKVAVAPAHTGKLTAKRTRSYPVIFSLP
jgi:hypothetical protein